MSTKTLRKRIALVAVASLAAGLVSVAPANAAATAVVASNVSINTQTAGTAAAIGLCSVSADESATITTSAALTFGAASSTGYFKIDSGAATFTAITGTGTTINAAASKVSFSEAASATLKPSALGSIRVIAATSADAVVETYLITVVSACAADAYSSDKSFVRAVSAAGSAINTNTDEAGATDVLASVGKALIRVGLKDAYSQALTTSGALVASATNGALVAWDGGTAISSTAVVAAVGDGNYVTVTPATTGAPVDTVVTLTFNGVTVGSRSIKIRGYAKSLKVTDVTVGKSGTAYSDTTTAGAGTFLFQWFDAAGNVVAPNKHVTLTTAKATALVSAAQSSSAGSNRAAAAALASTSTGSTSYSDGKYTCVGATKSGSAMITVEGTNELLEKIVSNEFTASCGGALDTWTLTTDKKSYNAGDIGTLTVTGKDANGSAVNDIVTLAGISGTATLGAGATFVVTPKDTDTFTNGVKTYKFYVGNTDGNYTGTATVTGATDTSAKTVSYSVSTAGSGTSNAAVLKAIVSLIASINKQIALLQKALLKK